MDSGLQQLASVRHLRVGELGLQLSQVFQGIRILFGAVERGAEEQIGVVEQVGLRGGCQKTTEYGQGLFSLIRIATTEAPFSPALADTLTVLGE